MSELLNKLSALEDTPQEEEESREEYAGFVVDDDQKADWCLKKIREAQAEKEKWADFYMTRMKQVFDRCDRTISFMEDKLKPYFATVPKKETKTQMSYQLPGGKLVLKRQAPEFERDDSALIPWLRKNYEGDWVKTKESVDWAALKKAFAEDDCIGMQGSHFITLDGEIIPGITVTERPDKFVVEIK